MVEDCEQQSHGQSSSGCRSLRSFFIFTIFLVLFLCYYIVPNELSESWAVAVGLFLPEKFTTKMVNDSLNTVPTVTSVEPWKPPEPYCVAYPHKYNLVLNEPEKCQRENPFVVLMVPVAPSNSATRDAIRSTWGSERLVGDKTVSILFLLGLPTSEERETLQQNLLRESEKYHDLIQSDFWDSYFNLTIKTMVMLEWLTVYCPNTSYAMKVDSDVFLNVKTLVSMLLSTPKQNYMTGLVARNAVVLRDPHSKWYLPKTVYEPPFYPPYALGLGYVFTLDLPEKLVKAAQRVKPVYIEDVFLGLCMTHLGIALTNPPDGSLFNVFPVEYNRCRYSKLIATTTRSLRDQVEFWKDLQRPGPYC
ncbi:beta-1,3-galactosyltransferase 2 [Sinocyclocheilus rhinocerous]|uniref:Hexosyltransferase n=1 Tax=Sinocyclocheilus rhinocerous TaxID=307959 RepID=A0A673GLI6_9TELE|nr:PREDICTED: beta-1,3-galactosyltransferase 2-like [Sinocyclocheilus rhinocerous]